MFSTFKNSLFSFLCLALVVCVSQKSFAAPLEKVGNLIHGAQYIFCIEGGGSKTSLEILNANGETVKLRKGNKELLQAEGSSSNIAALGEENFKKVVDDLLDGICLADSKVSISSIIPDSALIGSWAGIGRDQSLQFARSVLEELCFNSKRIGIFSDAGLAVELVGDEGGVLIAGTGSICLMKGKGGVKRFGGLGYRIGDEGSGYTIGLTAIRAAILDEYCNGTRTDMTSAIKKKFGLKNMSDLIIPINSNQLLPKELASVAPIVFRCAWENDLTAKIIVEKSANELANLLGEAITKSAVLNPNIYLVGGLFRDPKSSEFVDMILKSSSLLRLSEKKRPLLINISKLSIPVLVVKEALKYKKSPYYSQLQRLPILQDERPSNLFSTLDTSYISTEKECIQTKDLSNIFHKNPMAAIEMLHQLDASVLEGAESFSRTHLDKLHEEIMGKLQENGRIFLLGSGSSGRIAVNLAAKWNNFWKNISPDFENKVIPVMAGGNKAFVRCQENLEDHLMAGYHSLNNFMLNRNDTVILISSSGSAQFNIGAAHAAYKAQSQVYYFHNSSQVPEKTKELFTSNKAYPVLIDVGRQSIAGATGMQGGCVCELTIGILLDSLIHKMVYQSPFPVQTRALDLLLSVKKAWGQTKFKIPEISKLVKMEAELFANPNANLRKVQDETGLGYVTYLSNDDCLRELVTDCVGTSPCFSINPPRGYQERHLKRAEFRTFLSGKKTNIEAWEAMLCKEILPRDNENALDILISKNSMGYGDFESRFKEKGNILIGVFKSHEGIAKLQQLFNEMEQKKKQGAQIAIIAIQEKKHPVPKSFARFVSKCDAAIVLEDIVKDPLGVVSTLTLKQIMNLNSMSAMLSMNKIMGNAMVDVFPLNNKLVDRSIRTTQKVLNMAGMPKDALDYEMLYDYITRVNKYKELSEKQLKRYIPSPTKIVSIMLKKNCDVHEAVGLLSSSNENLECAIAD